MSKARRMKEKEKKTSSKLGKYFLILLILILIVFFTLFYLIKTNKIAFLSGFFDNLKFSDVEFKPTNFFVEAKPTQDFATLNSEQTIINSDKLVADGINITESSNKTYMISTTINNNSGKTVNKLKLKLYLYDTTGEEINSYNFSIDLIQKGSKSTIFTISADDLSKVTYYKLELNTKKNTET